MNEQFNSRIMRACKGEYYTLKSIDTWFHSVTKRWPETRKKRKEDVVYYNIPAAFDIETSNFKDEYGNALSTMYIWMFGLNGSVIVGRTWDDFKTLIEYVTRRMNLCYNTRLKVYIHNASFDWQFIKKLFTWEEIFAIEERKPLKARAGGIEYYCSYMLTGKSLEQLGKDLTVYKVEKRVGELDYSKMRHSKTPITREEVGYCINDVLVIMCHIQECIENERGIVNIPLTKTGYVRKNCRKTCLYNDNMADRFHYKHTMERLRMTAEEYVLAKRAYAGGYTHANAFYSNLISDNVDSFDFTSSYPAVMACKKFPMTAGRKQDVESWTGDHMQILSSYMKKFNCIMTVTFKNLKNICPYDTYISVSKAHKSDGVLTDNGRVLSAKELTISLTELDMDIILKTYKFSDIQVLQLWTYYPDYLPRNFIEYVLSLYCKKTEYKGVVGKEAEYKRAKEDVNSVYGMCVTDICRDEVIYDNDWVKKDITHFESISEYNNWREEKINEYNDSESRFISYLWGVYVSAHARHNLWSGILECGDDYIYSDTDSIKILNSEKHMDYINRYNKTVDEEMKAMCEKRKIDYSLTRPKTCDGVEKPLGHWDFDGHYKRFKTLGAKRYMVEKDDGKMEITIAGVSKKNGIEYLLAKYKTNDRVFKEFRDGMIIPGESDIKGYTKSPSGKLIHGYIDVPTSGVLIDYNGVSHEWSEKSSVTLMPADYTLGLAGEYLSYLLDLHESI